MGYTFDGPSKIITLTPGTTNVPIKDLWSRWVDWFLVGDNSKFLPAFSQVGGNDIDALSGTSIPIYAFLINGWRLRPQEADHTLSVVGGVLLVEGGGDPFLSTLGDFTVRVNYQQPAQAIVVDSGGGSGSVLDVQIEGTLTVADVLRIILASAAGKASGAGSTVMTFRNPADTKDRIIATVDPIGNRSVVTLDPST